jgi:hypothetical protein
MVELFQEREREGLNIAFGVVIGDDVAPPGLCSAPLRLVPIVLAVIAVGWVYLTAERIPPSE